MKGHEVVLALLCVCLEPLSLSLSLSSLSLIYLFEEEHSTEHISLLTTTTLLCWGRETRARGGTPHNADSSREERRGREEREPSYCNFLRSCPLFLLVNNHSLIVLVFFFFRSALSLLSSPSSLSLFSLFSLSSLFSLLFSLFSLLSSLSLLSFFSFFSSLLLFLCVVFFFTRKLEPD